MFSITCPYCGNTLPIANILQDRKTGKARGRCSQCKIWIPILLPSIRKKLVYLDQSFLSDTCLRADTHDFQNEVRILSKLNELKARQRIFVVVSDVHSRETSAFPDEYAGDRRRLWQFQNDLADGSVADDWDEVFVAQWRRMFANQDCSHFFPTTDIGLDDPHQLQVGMRIQPTNHWRQKLHRDHSRPRDRVNEELHRIFERRLENMPDCKDVRDCLSYVRELWHQEIRQGIAAWRQQQRVMEQIVKDLEAGRIPDIPPLEASAPFRQVVGEVVKGLEEEIVLQRWLELLRGESTNLSAFMRIRTAFEAELLWKWRTGCPPTNPDTFNRRFGMSCQNDIDPVVSG